MRIPTDSRPMEQPKDPSDDVLYQLYALVAPAADVRIRARAYFSDGTSRDVTDRACYELSNLNAKVDADGRVRRSRFGETTLVVRYLQQQVPVPIAQGLAVPGPQLVLG